MDDIYALKIPKKYSKKLTMDRNLKIFNNGKKMKQMTFTNVNMSPQEIRNLAQRISDQLKEKGFNGSIQIEMDLMIGNRSGRFTKVGDSVESYIDYDGDDPDEKVNEFRIYIKKDPERAGGAGENNDCLYECLIKAADNKILKIWKTPVKFKMSFKLRKCDKFPLDKIPELEKKLKMRIYVTGDHVYTSKERWNPEIHLELKDGHFTLIKPKRIYIPKLNEQEKPVVIAWIRKEKDFSWVLIGNKIAKWPMSKLAQHRKYYLSSPYVIYDIEKINTNLIPKKEPTKDEIKEMFVKAYNEFIEMATSLNEKTDGKINLYKGTFKQVALNYWSSLINLYIPEEISEIEQAWLRKASMGATMFSRNYEGPCYKYDFKSDYPFIMTMDYFYVPIQKGKFKKMTQEEFDNWKRIPYGIYRCKIIYENKSIFFRENRYGYYTHFDLNTAKELGYQIILIDDEQANFLYYPQLVKSKNLFGEYVNTLFALKEQKVPGAKNLLNILHGALSEINKKTLIFEDDGTGCDTNGTVIYNNWDLMNITQIGENTFRLIIENQKNIYKTPFGRLQAFLLGMGRRRLFVYGKDYEEYIVRMHTDSFFITKKIPDEKLGNNMGDLVYEGYSEKCTIIHTNKAIGEFIK